MPNATPMALGNSHGVAANSSDTAASELSGPGVARR
jgi:hypothetical protein